MSVKMVQLLTTLVPETLEITWEIEELHRQTSIEDSSQAVQNGSANSTTGRRTQQLNPSPKEIISVSVEGKPSVTQVLFFTKYSLQLSYQGAHSAKWYFSLGYYRTTGTDGEWRLCLQRKTQARDSVIVQLDMKIMNTDGSEFWRQSAGPLRLYPAVVPPQSQNTTRIIQIPQQPPTQILSEWSESKFWSIANALDLHNVLVEGSLTLYIRLQQLDREVHKTYNEMESEVEVEDEDKVGKDMKALLVSGENSDFEIQVTSNGTVQKVFKVHKCILGARSTTFSKMLAEDSDVIKNGFVTFEDVFPDTVQILLAFIYSGTVDLNIDGDNQDTIMREVFCEAVKWKLSELVEMIGSRLINLCTPKNAMDLLKLAKENNLIPAVQEIRNYIQKNIQDIL